MLLDTSEPFFAKFLSPDMKRHGRGWRREILNVLDSNNYGVWADNASIKCQWNLYIDLNIFYFSYICIRVLQIRISERVQSRTTTIFTCEWIYASIQRCKKRLVKPEPGRTVKEEQEQISPNHVPTIFCSSVLSDPNQLVHFLMASIS